MKLNELLESCVSQDAIDQHWLDDTGGDIGTVLSLMHGETVKLVKAVYSLGFVSGMKHGRSVYRKGMEIVSHDQS